jgi:hypothetical protein
VTHATTRRIIKDVVAVVEKNFPEGCGQTVFINPPRPFKIVWSFVKPMLDPKTLEKFSTLEKSALLDLVDADQLPALFGVTCI